MNTKRLKTSEEKKVGIMGTDDDAVEKNSTQQTKEIQDSKGEYMRVENENLIKGDKRPVLLTFNTREAGKGIELLEEQAKLAIDAYDDGSDSTMESGLSSVTCPSFASSIDMSSFYQKMNSVESSGDDITEEIKIEPETGPLELDRSAIDFVRTPSFLYSSGEDEQSYPRSRFPSLDEVTEATNEEIVMDSQAKTAEDDETPSVDSLDEYSYNAASPAVLNEVEDVPTIDEATDKADEVTGDEYEESGDFSETVHYESTLVCNGNQSLDDDTTIMNNDETVTAAIAVNVVQDSEISEPQKVVEDIVITYTEPSDEEVAQAMDEDFIEPSEAGEDVSDEKDYQTQPPRSQAAGFKRKHFMEETWFAPAPRRSLRELQDSSHADFPGNGALAISSHDDQNMDGADTATMNDSVS